jgi:metallophosphoesterase (TIGR00282 family)
MLKILAIGDIIGRPGRRVIRETLPSLKKAWNLDCVIANVENSAGGFGITHPIYSELIRSGIDLMTSGNHIYDKKDTVAWINSAERLVRPMNYPPGNQGHIQARFTTESGHSICVINLMGRVFMNPYDCPFRSVDTWLKEHDSHSSASGNEIVLVDIHAEATSEKQAMGWHLAGRVSAVWGTHTHVPTADARILEEATGFITDLGMTGPYDSVIGMQRKSVLEGFYTMQRNRFEVAKQDLRMAGCIFEIDSETGRCTGTTPVFKSLQDLENEIHP